MSKRWVTCFVCAGSSEYDRRFCRNCGGCGLVEVSPDFSRSHAEVWRPTGAMSGAEPDVVERVLLGIFKVGVFALSTFISVFVCVSAVIMGIRIARWLGLWP